MSNFDHVIFCTGWKFDNSIFDLDLEMTPNNKYPKIKPHFESNNNKNLYFIGSLMHSLDFKKSSGGFIHGFRYLIKLFTQIKSNFVRKRENNLESILVNVLYIYIHLCTYSTVLVHTYA
jgi:hypothetical protein